MGCVSSKVAQKPLEQQSENESRRGGGDQGQALEESRPALPVLENVETKTLADTKNKGRGKSQLAAGHSQHGKVRRQSGGSGEEKEGETITDASGLQMRTPRTSTDPCLHSAAKNGDLSLVHMLLGNSGGDDIAAAAGVGNKQEKEASPTLDRIDLDERGMWGNTPLLVATQYAHPQVALALIARGANTCLENERRVTALHFSCAEGLVDVGRALIDNGARVDPHVAAVHHPGVNGGQTVPVSPLSAAAIGGHTELVRLLLQHGAEVNRRLSSTGTGREVDQSGSSGASGFGGSALTAAAQYGHTETCLALIDSGANMFLEDSDLQTPFLHAIRGGHEVTAMALLDAARSTACANQLVEGSESGPGISKAWVSSPLHVACDKGLHEVTKSMLSAGAKVDSKDADGATALLLACRKGRLECVRQLVWKGASPMASDDGGNTPLSVARGRSDQARGKEVLEVVETAVDVGGGSGERDVGDIYRDGPRQEENEINDEDEDVLLVSDWDEERLDMMDTADSSGVRLGNTNQHTHHIARNIPEMAATSMNVRVDEDEDEDVLLVGDYDPDIQEQSAFLVAPSSPVPGHEEVAESPEVQPWKEGDSPGSAPSKGSNSTQGCIATHASEAKMQPSGGVEEAGSGSERYVENRPSGVSKSSVLVSSLMLTNLTAIDLIPHESTAKLVAFQVAEESVDRAMAVAANNALAAQPQPAGGA